MNRREAIAMLGGAALAPPFAASAQQALPVIAVVNAGTSDAAARNVAAFRKGLSETGVVEGQTVAVEYHWLEGHYDRLPGLMAELIRRRVAVITTPGTTEASLVAKAATETIPIVFGVSEDPVKLGLVASLSRPGGNATGVNFFVTEVAAKRLDLLHELVPGATRIAVLVNPANTRVSEATLRALEEGAHALRLKLQALHASTDEEIVAAFAAVTRVEAEALFVAGDAFFFSRRDQFAALAARARVPTSFALRELAEAGALMSYGTSLPDMFRQVAIYAGSILKGAKAADLPVVQPSKFEFVINLRTAKALGIEVPPMLLARADEVIE
jgi:ABC-type uncharacterized transport system substrate-binding protein